MSSPIFWLLYTMGCVWIHSFLPGLDCFAPALIVCLHLGHYQSVFWLGPAWLLINEGLGTYDFGPAIIWYAGLILFFFAIQVFFSSRHIYFVFLCAVFAGCWQFFVYSSMAGLQEIAVPSQRLLRSAVLTMCFFPIVWMVIQGFFRQSGVSRHVQW